MFFKSSARTKRTLMFKVVPEVTTVTRSKKKDMDTVKRFNAPNNE